MSGGFSEAMKDINLSEDSAEISEISEYEEYYDIEIIDGFYLQNAAYETNEKIQFFAKYWMTLYSNCCKQRNEALDFLNLDAKDEAIKLLQDWPESIGCPSVPQILQDVGHNQRKKPKRKEIDPLELIKEMKKKFQCGIDYHYDVPNILPNSSEDYTLEAYENKIKQCESCFQTVENYHLKNAFMYGLWLNQAFERFQNDKKRGLVNEGNFEDWINIRCSVKSRRARQLRSFSTSFMPFKKILGCKLPFIWFLNNGKTVLEYFKANEQEAIPWTHNCECSCEICTEYF